MKLNKVMRPPRVSGPNIFVPGTFTGATVTWPVSDALLSEVRHRGPKDVATHIHEAAYFSVLLEGTYYEAAPDFAMAYEPYSLIFHSAGTEHYDTIGPPGSRMFFVELLSPWNDVLAHLGDPPAHIFELHGGAPLWLVLQLYREFLFRDPGDATTVESLLHELCTYACTFRDDDPREPPWVTEVDQLLRSTFRSHPRSPTSPWTRASTRDISAERFASSADSRWVSASAVYACNSCAAGSLKPKNRFTRSRSKPASPTRVT